MIPFIILTIPGLLSREIKLERDHYTIGRSPRNDIIIENVVVSRLHGLFERNGTTWTYTNLSTSNGTLVERTRIQKVTLKDGLQLQIGIDSAQAVIITMRMDVPARAKTPARIISPPGEKLAVGKTDVSIGAGILLPESIGRYNMMGRLDIGGMAIVYKAFDTKQNNNVAIKFIRTDKTTNESKLRARKYHFEREIILLEKLNHPNIVPILDYGEYSGEPFYVMPLLLEGTLSQRMGRPIPWVEAIKILRPIAEALHYAHINGVIHKDVKPSNILFKNGQPILSDFGIAQADVDDEVERIGTPEYMAPEQNAGKSIDPRSDIYSFGIVLYEMITGKKPIYDMGDKTYDGNDTVTLKGTSLISPRKLIPEIPEDLDRVILKSIAPEKENRFRNMQELILELGYILMIESDKFKKQTTPRYKNPTKGMFWDRIPKISIPHWNTSKFRPAKFIHLRNIKFDHVMRIIFIACAVLLILILADIFINGEIISLPKPILDISGTPTKELLANVYLKIDNQLVSRVKIECIGPYILTYDIPAHVIKSVHIPSGSYSCKVMASGHNTLETSQTWQPGEYEWTISNK